MNVECERKFLITRPDEHLLDKMKAEASEITQTYLLSTKERTARVRRRIYADKTVYTHTEKRRLSAASAIEEEREITEAEYAALTAKADPACRVIQKTRYTLPYEGHLLEIDVYPFWSRQAVLEIELASEAEEFKIPREIKILREVTEEGAYKNAALAKHIPEEE
jgi:CYTH domain-containing protein